ncbi:hypothetical protein NC652_031073 [Populus alba x Populus x berolinensis]|nr:hypothetical protein NC652_031073 [Populus alba x Populus x berolinensis]
MVYLKKCFLYQKKIFLQVQLIPYNPDVLDESILWTESKDMGDGFRAVRMVNNTHLNVDAFHGDKKSGGVHDGTSIVLWKWNKGDNHQWKIIPTRYWVAIRVANSDQLVIWASNDFSDSRVRSSIKDLTHESSQELVPRSTLEIQSNFIV